MSYKKILEAHGIKEEELNKWAEEHYPKFIANKPLMMSLFFDARGIDIAAKDLFPSAKQSAPKSKVKDLIDGQSAMIEVVIAKKLGNDREYAACPKCSKKLGDDNRCIRHGIVKPVIARSAKYIVGDDTGDVIINLTPWVMKDLNGEAIEGQTLSLIGTHKIDAKYGAEFAVREVRKPDDEDADKEEAVEETKAPKKVSETLKIESARVQKLLDEFGEMTEPELKAYVKQNKLKSTPQEIMEFLGLKSDNGKLIKLE